MVTGEIGQVFAGISLIIMTLVLVKIITELTKIRPAYGYRKTLTDLYIAGKISKLAAKDGIDLEEEYKDFLKFTNETNRKKKEIDNAIEDEISEEIVNGKDKKK